MQRISNSGRWQTLHLDNRAKCAKELLRQTATIWSESYNGIVAKFV